MRMLLGVALSLLNLVLNPTGYLGAGIQVRVVGRDNTQ